MNDTVINTTALGELTETLLGLAYAGVTEATRQAEILMKMGWESPPVSSAKDLAALLWGDGIGDDDRERLAFKAATILRAGWLLAEGIKPESTYGFAVVLRCSNRCYIAADLDGAVRGHRANEAWIFGKPRTDEQMALWAEVEPALKQTPPEMIHHINGAGKASVPAPNY